MSLTRRRKNGHNRSWAIILETVESNGPCNMTTRSMDSRNDFSVRIMPQVAAVLYGMQKDRIVRVVVEEEVE